LFVHYGIEDDNNANGQWNTQSIAFPGTEINGEGHRRGFETKPPF
jgi:hypothetical protein